MNAIDQALLNYSVAFNRLPCPADLTRSASSQYYGVEAANPGTSNCTGGSVRKCNVTTGTCGAAIASSFNGGDSFDGPLGIAISR